MYHRWKKIHPDSDPPENILLRLNYIQRWNVCQKSLKILCLHSVNSLETRKKKSCYFRLVPVFRKCVPCGTFLESSLYDVINAHMDLFRFQVCFFSSICIIVFFTLNCIDFRKKKLFEALNVSIIDTDEAVPPKWGCEVPVGCPFIMPSR